MTLADAIVKAIAASAKVETAVVKATKGELVKGYYTEPTEQGVPESQIVAIYTAGRRSWPSLESDV